MARKQLCPEEWRWTRDSDGSLDLIKTTESTPLSFAGLQVVVKRDVGAKNLIITCTFVVAASVSTV